MSRHSLYSVMVSFLFAAGLGSASALAAMPGPGATNKMSPRPVTPGGLLIAQANKEKRDKTSQATTATPAAGATADAATAEQTAAAATKSADLNGVYSGVVYYPLGGLRGDATLTVEGEKFTLQQGANSRTGTLRRSGTYAFLKFDGSDRLPISLRVNGAGARLMLKTPPEEAQAFLFKSGGREADLRAAEKGAKPVSHAAAVTTLAFSPDGSRLASGGHGELFLWNAAATNVINSLPVDSGALVKSVAFSPDKSVLAVTTGGGGVTLYNAMNGGAIGALAGSDGKELHMLAFSPDGKMLVGGTEDGRLLVWDMPSKQPRQPIDGGAAGIRSVAFSPDGRLLAAGGKDGAITIWDAATMTQKRKLNGSSQQINALAFSRDGKLLASGGRDQKVSLWEVDKEGDAPLAALPGHEQTVTSLAFSPDYRTLASVGLDKQIILWDVASKSRKEGWKGESELYSVAFSPNRRVLATGGKDGNLILWNLK